jgi:hypothetical protein
MKNSDELMKNKCHDFEKYELLMKENIRNMEKMLFL